MVFEKMGGEVVYFGKPYPEVYNQSIDNFNKRILSIGDNLNTDIKGANVLNYHSLLISNGIHKKEIKDKLKIFLEKRAINNDKRAIVQIAKLYENYLDPPDMINAYTWYNIAVAKGIKSAKAKRDEILNLSLIHI